MLFVKALSGSFFGGVIGAIIAELTAQQLGTSMPWIVLVAGLLGGVGTRLLCGDDRTFSTGVIAAVATVLAISGVSYVMSSSASKTAKRSMEAIPVRTDLDDRIAEELEAEVESRTDRPPNDEPVPNDNNLEEASAPTTANETEDVSAPDLQDKGIAELAEDDRPAEMESSTDAWGTKLEDRLRAEDASSPMRSNSVLLFYLLSGLVAFVLGSGNGSNETADKETFAGASDQAG